MWPAAAYENSSSSIAEVLRSTRTRREHLQGCMNCDTWLIILNLNSKNFILKPFQCKVSEKLYRFAMPEVTNTQLSVTLVGSSSPGAWGALKGPDVAPQMGQKMFFRRFSDCLGLFGSHWARILLIYVCNLHTKFRTTRCPMCVLFRGWGSKPVQAVPCFLKEMVDQRTNKVW